MVMTQQQQAGQVTREEFGAQQTMTTGSTSDSAVAAQMQAQVQARYIMAMRRPRSWDQVRTTLLHECKRPSFAEVALYDKPVGGSSITGLSIRFAEAAVRCMTNMQPETMTIYDDSRKRIVRVQVTDVESNVTYSTDLIIEKTVERSRAAPGQTVISQRVNSRGRPVYIVEATEGDLMTKEGAHISKALRNLVLRMLPGDIQDDCRAAINATLTNKAARDPDAERKAIADAFSGVRVQPVDLEKYLGHPLAQMAPAEVVELRRIYRAIKDGETTWRDVLADRIGDEPEEAKPEAEAPQPGVSRADAIADKLAKKPLPAKPQPTKQPAPKPDPNEEDEPWTRRLQETANMEDED
jgi:hypothetical protein